MLHIHLLVHPVPLNLTAVRKNHMILQNISTSFLRLRKKKLGKIYQVYCPRKVLVTMGSVP